MTDEKNSEIVDLPMLHAGKGALTTLLIAIYIKYKKGSQGMKFSEFTKRAVDVGLNEGDVMECLGSLQRVGWASIILQQVGTASSTEQWLRLPSEIKVAITTSEKCLLEKISPCV